MKRSTAILQLFMTQGLGAKGLRRLLKALEESGREPHGFVQDPDEAWLSALRRPSGLRDAILEARDEAQHLAGELSRHDIRVITFLEDGYPERLNASLRDDAPPVVFAYGDVSTTERKTVGFCGSRRATERGITFTKRVAEALAAKGVNVVSGYASGVDTAAHAGALRSHGITTIVLPEGILQFRMKRELYETGNEKGFLVISEFPPRLPWAAHNAMRRNTTICGLSDAVVVVEAGERGGTFEAGKTALRLGLPLFVVDYLERDATAQGSMQLLREGGNPIRTGADGPVDLDLLLEILQEPRNHRRQPDLFDAAG
jgi:DNA processing protein